MANEGAKPLVIASVVIVFLLFGLYNLIAIFTTDQSSLGVFNNTLTRANTINSTVYEMRNTIERNATSAPDLADIVNGLVKSTVGVFKLLWTTLDITTALINDFGEGALGFSIPDWFSAAMILILVTILVFAIMSAIFKWYL